MSTLWQNLIQWRCVKKSYCLFGSCNQWYIHPTYNFAHSDIIFICGNRSLWKSKVVVVSKVVTSKVPVVVPVVKRAVTGKWCMQLTARSWCISLVSHWIPTFSKPTCLCHSNARFTVTIVKSNAILTVINYHLIMHHSGSQVSLWCFYQSVMHYI
jgi:hypothetical protein